MKPYSIFFCFLFAAVANSFSTAKAQVDVNDSLALVDLYNSTNGPGWSENTNWLTINPVSTWFGITVSDSRVITIDLDANNLSGIIPSSIGNFANLEYLDFWNNHLSGSIPASIGNLTKLEHLDLTFNHFSGRLPSSIGNLTHLTFLSILYSDITGSIPSSFGNLVHLEWLLLGGNHLSGSIPPSIGKITSLYALNLSDNQLTGPIPSSFDNAVHLGIVSLDHNRLNGSIPLSFGKHQELWSLNLSYNQLFQPNNADFPNAVQHPGIYMDVSYNRNTFNGFEYLARFVPRVRYAPQANIPIHQRGNSLSVNAGGTLSNNTYNWYKVGSTDSTVITADSTFQPKESGKYYVYITNAIATQLTLYADTIDFTINSLTVYNGSLADVSSSKLKQGLQVYPNPANSIVQVQVNGAATIILTNSAGKLLLTRNITNNAFIHVSSFAPGIYYIQNKDNGEVKKVVVTH